MKIKILCLALLLGNVVRAQNIGIGTTNPLQRVDVTGNTFFRDSIGIGILTPHAPLQLPQAIANRKLVVYEEADNNHQFDGFGTVGNGLRYQVAGTLLNHVFYAASSATASVELMRIAGSGFVGLGVTNPTALLHLNNSLVNKKIILFQSAANDHQFMGLGVNSNMLRYQVDALGSDHVFYAGLNGSSSIELMRIKGDRRVGIAESNPSSLLANTPTNTVGSDGIGVQTYSFNWAMDAQGYVAGLYNQSVISGSNGLLVKIAGTSAGHTLLDLSTNGTQAGVGNSVMIVRGNGNVGIGTKNPHAALQLGAVYDNRRMILYETANNAHEFYGWGVNSGELRYQVNATASDHVFYAAASASASNELFRIRGNGRIGIGISNPFTLVSNTALNIAGSDQYGVGGSSITWGVNAQGYGIALYNQSTVFGSNGLAVKIAGTTNEERILDLSTGASQDTPGVTVMAVLGNGNVNIPGLLSKGGGSFKIDHPLDPANKYLYHSFVESPDMMNIYNGNIITGADGLTTVTLPDYFEALNKEFRYQLTVIGEFAQAIVLKKISNNRFTIKTDKPNVEVSWQVTGIRHDPFAEKNRIPNTVDKPAKEKGHYLHPEAGR